MKNMYLIIVLTLAMSFLLMPLLAVEQAEKEGADSTVGTSGIKENENTESEDFEPLNEIKLYLKDEDKIESIDSEEYILGVVAAEMQADYDIEAIKAQALASYTFAYFRHMQNSEQGNEYDITNDTANDQGYLDSVGRQAKWGDKYAEYEEKVVSAVKSIKNQLIVYKNAPILAAYHAISCGNTERATNVWNTDYPYLQSENSIGDLLSPDFLSEVKLTTENFTAKLRELGCEVTGEPSKYIGKIAKSDAGYVTNITLGGKKFTGDKIRETFSLRSASFDLIFKEDTFIFTVSGYGHGVGMSQFGANYMAEQGSTYDEIISAYYRGVKIVNMK